MKVLRELHRAIATGKTFSAALAEHPRLFSPIYVKMVEVAEATGRLDQALASLAEERGRIERMRKKLVGAISYPAFLIVAALSAMVFIFTYVIPQFETALEGFRDKIDPTALMCLTPRASCARTGRGSRSSSAARCSRSSCSASSAPAAASGSSSSLGCPGAHRVPPRGYGEILPHARRADRQRRRHFDALRLLRDVVRLPAYATEVDGVVADVRKGRRLSEALESRSFLPRHVVQMLRVGEDSGRLPDSASRVAVFYEARLDIALTRAIAVIGPATMILVSILIAWLIISVMTALMSVNDLLK